MPPENVKASADFIFKCRNPFFLINTMWGLTPQPCFPEYKANLALTEPENWKAEWFGTLQEDGSYKWNEFRKGQHITWQQCAVLEGIRRASSRNMTKEVIQNSWGGDTPPGAYFSDKNKVAVKSGNGIGKSCLSAWVVVWFLFAFYKSAVPCTAPTSSQMNDVLWKEVALWISKMPQMYQDLFDVTSSYIRMKAAPEVWFARARTSRKENPEAFSGIHADSVMALADEASGVPDIIFDYGKGIATAPFWMFLMFSNPTRLTGNFKKAFSETSNWRQFTFKSTESPVVNQGFVREKLEEGGYDSDDYRVFVNGEFPKSDAMDDSGFVPLLTEAEVRGAMVPHGSYPVGVLGVDPSGEGHDKSAFVGRTHFVGQILAEEATSSPKSVASKACTFIVQYGLGGRKTVVDNFGEGANVSQEMALMGFVAVGVNVGNKSDDVKFLNKRAELTWKMREWIKSGGTLMEDDRWLELLNLRYRYNESGKLQIMSKEKMRKEGIKSPNFADAFMLTFAVPVGEPAGKRKRAKVEKFDIYNG